MLRYGTPKTVTENAARIETVTFHPQTGQVTVLFTRGFVDENDSWTELAREACTISPEEVPDEMDPHAAAVVGWVYQHLQSLGLLPA
jgi:hypothetical protein